MQGSGFGSVMWPRTGRLVGFLVGLWWFFVEGSGFGSEDAQE